MRLAESSSADKEAPEKVGKGKKTADSSGLKPLGMTTIKDLQRRTLRQAQGRL